MHAGCTAAGALISTCPRQRFLLPVILPPYLHTNLSHFGCIQGSAVANHGTHYCQQKRLNFSTHSDCAAELQSGPFLLLLPCITTLTDTCPKFNEKRYVVARATCLPHHTTPLAGVAHLSRYNTLCQVYCTLQCLPSPLCLPPAAFHACVRASGDSFWLPKTCVARLALLLSTCTCVWWPTHSLCPERPASLACT
jgi:hypothetical protein